MHDKNDQRIAEALRNIELASEPHELPGATRMWSQLQFRLRYRPQRTSDAYAFSCTTAIVGVYVLLFQMWNTQVAWLDHSLMLILGFAAVAALLLWVRVSRDIRG
jgi:hypothetical protein